MHTFNALPVIGLLAAIFSSNGLAQTVDSFEFGRNSAAAVKIATQLDYVSKKCKAESATIYLNQTNSVLGHIGGRSSKSVLEGSSLVMGVTPEKVNQLAIDEAEGVISSSGGCKSTKLQSALQDAFVRWGEYQRYLAEVADLMHRNPGRKIFR